MNTIHSEPQWLSDLRAVAQERAVRIGLPTLREEAWRFSDLRKLRAAMSPQGEGVSSEITAEHIAPYFLPQAAHRLVFVDGLLAPELSAIGALPPGCWLANWSETLAHRPQLAEASFTATDTLGGRHFAAVNAAQFSDGMVLVLEPGVELPGIIELIQFSTAAAPVHLRHFIQMGVGSAATLLETAIGIGAASSNGVTTVTLADAANLTHAKLQAEPETAVHLAEFRAQLGTTAKLNSFYLIQGAALSRQDIHAALAGTGAELRLGGSYLLHGQQEATIVPVVDHQVAGCQTTEIFKGVLEEQSHGVFLGSIIVREGADQTEAHQQNHNLLTGPQARIDTRPELTIYADEVKCSHGATVGDLDEAALFYLQARGITPDTARQMLIAAFAVAAIDSAELPGIIADWLTTHLHARLGAAA